MHNSITLGFKLYLYVQTQFLGWGYSWSCFFLLGAVLTRVILVNSFADEVSTPSALVKTALRVFGLGLICTVFFKVDGLIELSWTSSLWYFTSNFNRSYWILFTIMVLISLAVVLVTCSSAYSMVTGEVSANECTLS